MHRGIQRSYSMDRSLGISSLFGQLQICRFALFHNSQQWNFFGCSVRTNTYRSRIQLYSYRPTSNNPGARAEMLSNTQPTVAGPLDAVRTQQYPIAPMPPGPCRSSHPAIHFASGPQRSGLRLESRRLQPGRGQPHAG